MEALPGRATLDSAIGRLGKQAVGAEAEATGHANNTMTRANTQVEMAIHTAKTRFTRTWYQCPPSYLPFGARFHTAKMRKDNRSRWPRVDPMKKVKDEA